MPLDEPLSGEITAPAASVRLQSFAAPFRAQRVDGDVPAGLTIAEMLDLRGLGLAHRVGAQVWVDDVRYEARQWHRVKPHAGRTVTVRIMPLGGGGGSKVLRSVLTLAVVVAATYVMGPSGLGLGAAWGLGTTGTALAISGISMLGMLAINALIPPPSNNSSTSQSYGLSPGSNKGRQYQPIPKILGKRRIFCDYGASPVTETTTTDQYLRCLWVVGYGPLQIDDIKLGDTLLTEYTDYELEVRQGYADDAPITLYTDTPVEINPGIQLREIDGWVTREIDQTATELQWDIIFPAGIYHIVDGNNHRPSTGQVEIQYALLDSDDWTATAGISVTVESTAAVRRSLSVTVPSGRYQTRMRRVIDHDNDSNYSDSVTWTAFRAIQPGTPIKRTGLAMIALKIRANNQLNGAIADLNCIATSIIPDWDAPSGTWITRATQNPASCFRELLQGQGNQFPQADSMLDLDGLQDWHVANSAAGRLIGWRCDDTGTLRDRLRQCAAVGRAQFQMRDGKYGVVRDVEQDLAVQMFTPRNSWGFKASRTFTKPPHGIRVRFANPLQYWSTDERIAYADGYDESTATLFELLDLSDWVCDSDQAWREARFHWAQGVLRAWTYELQCDVENLVAQRGDRVEVMTDVLEIGITTGRIASVSGTTITTDEVITVDGTQSYGVLLRKADIAQSLVTCTLAAGGTQTIELSAPVTGLAKGDLFTFGVTGKVTAPMLVKAIYPANELTARLELLDYAPGVLAADTGEIPAWDSHLTTGTPIPAVTGLTVVEDVRWVNGATQSVLVIDWDRSSDIRVDSYSLMASTPAGDWINVPLTRPTGADIAPAALGFWNVMVWATTGDGRRSVAATTKSITVDGLADLVAPNGLAATGSLEYLADGTPIPAILVTWTPSSEATGGTAIIQWRESGATSWLQLTAGWGAGQAKLYPVRETVTYEIQIATATSTGVRSAFSDSIFFTFGNVLEGASVTGLELFGQGNDTEFVGNDIHIVWQGNFPSTSYALGAEPSGAGTNFVNPYFQDYVVQVIDPGTGVVVREERVTAEEYIYTYDKNATDAGGPRRTVKFAVAIEDILGGTTAAATLTVTNPVPTQVQISPMGLANGQVLLAFIPPSDVDFAGVNAWFGATADVDTSGVPAVTGISPPLSIGGLTAGQTYYGVVQTFDTFGSAGCPISAAFSWWQPYVTAAQMAAEIIDKTKLTQDLADTIDLITDPADVEGSVAYQVAQEAAARGAAIITVQAAIDNTATNVTSLAAVVNDPSTGLPATRAQITDFETAQAGTNSATASSISTLTSQVNDPSTGLPATRAALQTFETTQAGTNSATASSISTIQTTVDGHTASLSAIGTSIDGIEAEYTVRIDVDGYVAGFGLIAGGGTSQFIVRTDVFAMVPPGSTVAQAPFVIGLVGGVYRVVIDNGFIENLDAAKVTSGTLGAGVIYANAIYVSQLVGGSVSGLTIWATATGTSTGAGWKLDGPNQQLSVFDGTRARILLGLIGGAYGGQWIDENGRVVVDINDLGAGVSSDLSSLITASGGTSSTKGAYTSVLTIPAFKTRGNQTQIQISVTITSGTDGNVATANCYCNLIRTNTRTGASTRVYPLIPTSDAPVGSIGPGGSATFALIYMDAPYSDPDLDSYQYDLKILRFSDSGSNVYPSWTASNITAIARWWK